MNESDNKRDSSKHLLIVKILKVLGWTALSIAVLGCVLLFCAVKFIDSERLAPMVENMANEYIDGHVKLGKLKLGFHPRFPILGVEVENLTVISHAFDSLTPEQKGLLPDYADSLLTLDHMAGAFDIKRLIFNNELALKDVVLSGLGVNLVIAHDDKANYNIIKIPSDTRRTSKKNLPGIRLDHFTLDNPKEIRFYNASDSTSASVLLLTDADVDGHEQPTYRLKINGNVTSPKATLLTNLTQINFGVNGNLYWNPSHPEILALNEMELRGEFIKAIISCEFELKESPIIRNASVELNPVAITDIISILPDSIRKKHRLYAPYFFTDASIRGKFQLLEPMNLATDTIPTAKITISMPESGLDYGDAHFKDLALDVTVDTKTNLPDQTSVNLERFNIDGPGTKLKVSAQLSNPLSDLNFDAKVSGNLDIRDLPPILIEKIPGYLSGIISADLKATGSMSMFKTKQMHRLVADGCVTAKDVYYLTSDTSKMVQIGKAKIDFNTHRIVNDIPLLKANVAVDTATILVSGVDLALGSINLKAGIEHKGRNMMDTTRMMPIAGDLNVGRFNIIALKDSAGAKIRNIGGTVRMQESATGSDMPDILADLKIGMVSAGTKIDRVLIANTKVNACLGKQHSESDIKRSDETKAKPHKAFAYMTPADVYKYVYDKRRRMKHIRRVYLDKDELGNEILVWNLTKQFKGFLNEWRLSGSVNTNDASLLMPEFRLRNKITTVALKFNNDIVDISNISLQAGQSDVTFSGRISNVSNTLTSKPDSHLKGNFSLLSDTIDINELMAAILVNSSHDAETTKDSRHDRKSHMSPLLIPVNINANLRLEANHLLYSDLVMHNMGTDLLVYKGGINLHDLKADSDAGDLSVSALYSAPKAENMNFGFGLVVNDFNIAKFVNLVPAIDSITPLMHDFSGTIGADVAATCRIDNQMNLDLSTLNAAIRISGDNLAFIDPVKYRTLGKWLGFKNKADNTIHRLNVEMSVENGFLKVYPFSFNIDRYRLGAYGSNDINMNFDYHISVLKSPIPFKFGITIKGNPKKFKVKFGGARFNENTAIESVNIVNNVRLNLIEQIENVFKRGVQHSKFAKLQVARPAGFEPLPDTDLTPSDSLFLIQEGMLPIETASPGKHLPH